MTDQELIERAMKAIPIAAPHIAASLRRHVDRLTKQPGDRDARFWLETDTAAAWYRRRVQQYGTD